MIDFSTFTAADGSPMYRQILFFIKRGIVAGTVRDGDALPSRRALSALLGINPNTAQKIYRLLEEEALIRSLRARKARSRSTPRKWSVSAPNCSNRTPKASSAPCVRWACRKRRPSR